MSKVKNSNSFKIIKNSLSRSSFCTFSYLLVYQGKSERVRNTFSRFPHENHWAYSRLDPKNQSYVKFE